MTTEHEQNKHESATRRGQPENGVNSVNSMTQYCQRIGTCCHGFGPDRTTPNTPCSWESARSGLQWPSRTRYELTTTRAVVPLGAALMGFIARPVSPGSTCSPPFDSCDTAGGPQHEDIQLRHLNSHTEDALGLTVQRFNEMQETPKTCSKPSTQKNECR